MVAAVSSTQWTVGWIIAVAVILVVVVLVVSIIYLAAKIKGQLVAIEEALREARQNTEPLWEVQKTNMVADEILTAARTARGALGG